MKIKPSNSCYGIITLFFLCDILICVAFIGGKINIILTCIVFVFFFSYTIKFWITYGRTLIMDEEGCTVKFLGFSRKYKWTELKTKRIEDYTRALSYREPYTGGVIFYKKRTRKPQWITPANYSFCVHPFTFFFVYFTPNTSAPVGSYHYRMKVYEVNENEFLNQFKEWNVELEDVRN